MPAVSLDLLIPFVTALFASTYGASAGGSALLILPVLIFMGIPAKEAVASALLGYMGMNLVGVWRFHKADKVDVRLGLLVGTATAFGTVVGATILPILPENVLQKGIGVCIILILILFVLYRDIGIHENATSTVQKRIGYIVSIFMGIYLATVMAGTAILATYILIFFFGQTFLESAGTRKIIFLINNTIAIILLGFKGLILWDIAGALVIGNAIGCYVGVAYALEKGDRWVQRIFFVVTFLSAIKLIAY